MNENTKEMISISRGNQLCLLAMIMIGAISADIYLPFLNQIKVDLNTSVFLLQTSLAAYVLGLSISRFFWGFLSDSFRRQTMLIIGLTIGIFGQYLSYISNNLSSLLIARIIQSVGNASFYVIIIGIFTDNFSDTARNKRVNACHLANTFGTLISPTLGWLVLSYSNFTWKNTFLGILLLEISLILWFIFNSKQDFQSSRDLLQQPKKGLSFQYLKILKNREALLLILISSTVMGSYLIILSNLPFLYKEVFNATQEQYTITQTAGLVSYLFAGFFYQKMISKISLNRFLSLSLIGYIILSVLIVVSNFYPISSGIAYVTVLYVIQSICAAFIIPATISKALQSFSENYSSSVAASFSIIRSLIGSLFVILSGYIFSGTYGSFSVSFLASAIVVSLLLFLHYRMAKDQNEDEAYTTSL